ncbi:MAG: aconitate hydratase [Deltaproteobacteria bacterium]|nr:aconitate hydratase [Deltaproteobacteria bacterium]
MTTHDARIDSTPEFVTRAYERMVKNLEVIKKRVGRPMTLAEKILLGHLAEPTTQELKPGESYLMLRPDRVAMQDATAQMALLQFEHAGRASVAVPTTVHCDHLIQAHAGAANDLKLAVVDNDEVYEFLRTASAKYGIGFWKPGSGIIHQIVLENYAFPGGLMIGTDSHTPNAGGLGMIASGVGGADAVDVMAGFPWEVKYPKPIGVRLVGEMNGWTSPKDVILYLCGLLTVKGGTNRVIEYFGPGVRAISCTGKATICNMGAELGATGSVFPFDERMDKYLRGTGRAVLADLAAKNRAMLVADPDVEARPNYYFERVVEIDLSKLEPQVVGPHTPDLARPISKLADDVKREGYPDEVKAALIGSCTNSSYEDLSRVAEVAEEARVLGVKCATKLYVSPGSEQIRVTILRDGQLAALESAGGVVLSNACGPCIGQWKRDEVAKGEKNTIVTSFNRNFPARNDSNPSTLAFIASPEIVMAFALSGRLSFNPVTDALVSKDGSRVKLRAPRAAPDVPNSGFERCDLGYIAPPIDPGQATIAVREGSQRLQRIVPFARADGNDFIELPILFKAKGKCTTDHISPAGPWLKFRGHLDNISDNMFLGAVNAFTGEAGKGTHVLTSEKGVAIPRIARDLNAAGKRWVVVGDENYGEGSSREHAAMSPRFLGGAAIVVRSFARIHESNLKKQGLLPLTFANAGDYDKVRERDRMSLLGLATLSPGRSVEARLHHADGSVDAIELRHTLNVEQIAWFRAGSALNVLRAQGN